MGNGASSAPKQSVPNSNQGESTSPSKQGHSFASNSKLLPPAVVTMRAPWGSCSLSPHVTLLFSKLDFDVSKNFDLGCLHSVAIRSASEKEKDLFSESTKPMFAVAQRELGLLSCDTLEEQSSLFKDAAEKLEDFHEFAQTYSRIFCNDHIRSAFLRKKHQSLSAGTIVSTLPWLHSMVHAGVLFMMVNCKLLQFDIHHNMAESAFRVLRLNEQMEANHELQWEEDATHLKKWGRRPKAPDQGSAAGSNLMRTDAPDFDWPQPWEQVWTDQSIPSPSSAHHLIERTNKLWKSELAILRPLWLGARTSICPPLSCVIEEHGFFIKVIALSPTSNSGPNNMLTLINSQLSQVHAECNQLPLLKQYGHFTEGRHYCLMNPLFMTPLISVPAAASFISSKHGDKYVVRHMKRNFLITQDSAVLRFFQPNDAVEFHLMRRSLVHRVHPSLLLAAGQKFSVSIGESNRKMPSSHVRCPKRHNGFISLYFLLIRFVLPSFQVPDVLRMACDDEVPFMPVTQRVMLLQVAMFDLLPELMELLDHSFEKPASDSVQSHNYILLIEEHLQMMRRHFKSSGLGLMWLGVVRTHCSSPTAQAAALNEMAARVIKLEVRRRMRSMRVLCHKEGDGTDVSQTPKEDCILVQNALNSILLDWRSFCRSSLILLMTAKYPGCIHEIELNRPELMLSSINPMLCVERVAKLLEIRLDMTAFHKFTRDYPNGHDIFPTEFHHAQSLAHSVMDAMKVVAAPFKKISARCDQQIAMLTDDIVVSTAIVLKSHCPVAACQALTVLLETRMLILSEAGLMSRSPSGSVNLGSKLFCDDYQSQMSVCDDSFGCAFQPELLSTAEHQRALSLSPIMQIFCHMNYTVRHNAVVQFTKMSSALHGFHLELLSNNSSYVLVMIECLLALSDVANGSSKSVFLRSAVDWMSSLWKAQESTSVRAIRAFQRNFAKSVSKNSSWKKVISLQSAGKVYAKSAQTDSASSHENEYGLSHAAIEQEPAPKKYVSQGKAAAAQRAKEKERMHESIKDHDKVYSRIHDKLYHASVFVAFLCSCSPTATTGKLKSQWGHVLAGFELAYRNFISCVDEGLFSAREVKVVLWHTMMLLKSLANQYRVLQACRNPSASALIRVFDIFSRFAVTLDEFASSHFPQDLGMSYVSVFQPRMRYIIFVLSLNSKGLNQIFPHCPNVSQATFLLAEESYYQLLYGEMKALSVEMQDTVEKLEGPSVMKALSLLAKGKDIDPQRRRDLDAMKIVVSRLKQYSASDDFLSTETADLERRADNSVAVLILCLMVHCDMHLQDIILVDKSLAKIDNGSKCLNLKHTSISGDALHCLCTLLQGRGITSINCCDTILCGSIPSSFAYFLKSVTHLNLRAVKFSDIDDDFILRKVLSSATSATHVDLTYTRGVFDEDLIALANASGNNLISLQLCQNISITDVGLCYLATRCSSLQHLHALACENVDGQFVDFVAAYCPALATLDLNCSSIQPKFVSLLPQLTNYYSLRMGMQDIDLLLNLGAHPSVEEVIDYLKNQQSQKVKTQKALDTKSNSSKTRSRISSVIAHVKFTNTAPEETEISASLSSGETLSFDSSRAVKVSVAEANRAFGNLERFNEKALLCIEQWITLLYGPSESNRAWLGRAEFAPNMMSKYDAATDDYLVINEDDPEFEVQFNEMLQDFTRRGLDSEQCVQEVKAVLLKKRIEQKENVMAERRLVAEMERDRRSLSTVSEYEQIYHMSGRAAQDQDAIRRIKLEAEIATRKLTQRDRHRGIKGPMNIEFAPQTIMRTETLMKNSGDRLAVHPVLHIYVHCVLYENENDQASSKISSFINVSYDRQVVTTPPLDRSNFVDVMEGCTFDLRYGLSDMVVVEMREAGASAEIDARIIGIVFAPLPEFANGKPEKLWYKFKGVPPKVRELKGKVVPTLGGQVLISTMITTSEIRKRLEHALDSVSVIERQDAARSLVDHIRHSVGSKLKSMFSRAPLKQKVEEERLAKKARDEQLRAVLLLKSAKKMQILKEITSTKTDLMIAQPLVHLDLSSSCVHNNVVTPIILQATNLTVLRLSHCQNLTSNLFDGIISDNMERREAQGSPLLKLCTLSLRNTPACDDAALIRICGACTSLHSLDIGQSQRRITSASASEIAEGPGSRLKRLMMDNCPAVTEEFQNMVVAAVGANCSVLNIAFQTISSFAMSFVVSQNLLDLKLDGIAWVSSADVQRFCVNCPMLRVSDALTVACLYIPIVSFLYLTPCVFHALSLEHCSVIDDVAFMCDKPTNLQDVNVSYCVLLTDVGVLRLLSCSPRLQSLSLASLPLISNASLLALPARCPCITFLNIAFCSRVSSVISQALPVMLPNAKLIGIESLGFGSSEMSHVQVKRQLPVLRSEPYDSTHDQPAGTHKALVDSPESQKKPTRTLAAARRVFNTVRLSAYAAREAEERIEARAESQAK